MTSMPRKNIEPTPQGPERRRQRGRMLLPGEGVESEPSGADQPYKNFELNSPGLPYIKRWPLRLETDY